MCSADFAWILRSTLMSLDVVWFHSARDGLMCFWLKWMDVKANDVNQHRINHILKSRRSMCANTVLMQALQSLIWLKRFCCVNIWLVGFRCNELCRDIFNVGQISNLYTRHGFVAVHWCGVVWLVALPCSAWLWFAMMWSCFVRYQQDELGSVQLQSRSHVGGPILPPTLVKLQ